MNQIGKIDLKDILGRTIFEEERRIRAVGPSTFKVTWMFPRLDGLLLGTATYVAVGAAALGAAWLLADAARWRGVAERFPWGRAPVPAERRMTEALSLRSMVGIQLIDWTDILRPLDWV